MEDLDTPRIVPGAADAILRTLDALGFEWDGPVVYQHERMDLYRDALARLADGGRLFECSCSRAARRGGAGETGYPGTCRAGPRRPGPTATRLRIDEHAVESFDDRVQGHCVVRLRDLGDVVVRRRDGIVAYQLAVVVDDAEQAVTDVVRGADLLESTPWQLALQRELGLPRPRHAHLPVVTEPDGRKLAKARRSTPVGTAPQAASALVEALALLGQEPPDELRLASTSGIWAWARARWSLEPLAGRREIRLGAATPGSPHGP
jgi:glutamyl-Q tRNA(Asp) synthetase